MSDVTQVLSQIESGDPSAAEKLLPLVYEELRKLAAARLAQESPGQTLQATALVHEAYLRLVGSDEGERSWNSRGHFFGAAAEAMRRILLNRARDKGRLKRGGQRHRLDLEQVELAVDAPHEDLLALDESIERLAAESCRMRQGGKAAILRRSLDRRDGGSLGNFPQHREAPLGLRTSVAL